MESFFTKLDVNTLIIVVSGLVIIWNQYKQSDTKLAKEVKETYKERIVQLEQKVKDLDNHVNELIKTDAKKDGIIEEKDKQLQSYEVIFANRNPELEKILSQFVDFMSKLDKRMGESHAELLKQTMILNQK